MREFFFLDYAFWYLNMVPTATTVLMTDMVVIVLSC